MRFKALHNLAPKYITDLIHVAEPVLSLRFSSKNFLVVPKYSNARSGDRTFTYAAPTLWNSLPDSLRHIDELSSFKSNLKTYLFRKAFSA